MLTATFIDGTTPVFLHFQAQDPFSAFLAPTSFCPKVKAIFIALETVGEVGTLEAVVNRALLA